VVLALGLLAAGAAAVAVLTWRTARVAPRDAAASPVEVVAEVAGRHGCTRERVSAERSEGEVAGWIVTVHAPRGFPAERFVLDLQAAAHNLGGQLEPRPLGEKGGYGLARLDGTVERQRWSVVVIGDEPPRRRTPASARADRPRLSIVLDDAGNSLEPLGAIAALPRAVAVAVLPNAAHAAEVARELVAQDREVLLHMPMEAQANGGAGTGEGAIETGLGAEEIRARVARALDVVHGARGVNNHMGSRATADRAAMDAVMQELKARNVFFLDSRTTPDSVAEEAARAAGIPALRRDVFLDVTDDPSAVRLALRQAIGLAREHGHAVAIGHVHPVTLEVLGTALAHDLGGVQLVPPSRLVQTAR
jgi:polysaccharide deacetylase 2 family uncharacterized protein YibQ